MQVIGLCGFAGSGKSTVADYFVREHGFTRLSFAGAVKDITATLFGWDRPLLEGNTDDSRAWRDVPDPFWTTRMGRDWTPRYALQFVGTDLCRTHVHQNIWVDLVLAQIHRRGAEARVVIDDVRFVNEVEELRRIGATIAVVQRRRTNGSFFPTPEHARLWNDLPGQAAPTNVTLHRSEWDWLRVSDIRECPTILNLGNYNQLYTSVEQWYTASRMNSLFHEDVLV